MALEMSATCEHPQIKGWYGDRRRGRVDTTNARSGESVRGRLHDLRLRIAQYDSMLHERRRRESPRAFASALLVRSQAVRQTKRAEVLSLEQRFREQAEQWGHETGHLSSPFQRMLHPSYQAILGMAQENKEPVIRLLLDDMQKTRRPWFLALSFLTQENPIKQADAGKIDRMIAAWVEWGKKQDNLIKQ